MNALYRYIPSPILTKLNSYNISEYYKQQLICIIHAIYTPSIYKNKREVYMKDGYAEVNSSYLKNIDTNYSSLIGFLSNNNFIEFISGKYKREVSKFRINPSYLDCTNPLSCRVKITDKKLKTKIIHKYNQFNVTKKAPYIKTMEKDFKNSFRINLNDCITIIDEWYQKMINNTNNTEEIIFYNNKYIAYMYPLLQMKDGNYYYKRNSTNFRIDSNLTNLGKVFKDYIIGAEDLVQIDISNSQPFFIACIFKAVRAGNRNYTKYFTGEGKKSIKDINSYELEKFTGCVVQGEFYELFMKLGKIDDRDKAKQEAYAVMFSKNHTNENLKKRFKKTFPTIYNAIETLKNSNINLQIDKESHALFAILLQRIEAKIIIDRICREITEMGIKVYTIHDSVLFDKTNYDIVKSIIQEQFMDEFGINPHIKPDYFGNKKNGLKTKLYSINYEEGKVRKMLQKEGFEVINIHSVYHVNTESGIFHLTENQMLKYPNSKEYKHYYLKSIVKILSEADKKNTQVNNDFNIDCLNSIVGLTNSYNI